MRLVRTLVGLAMAVAFLEAPAARLEAQSCGVATECMEAPVCQPDGTCKGMPKPNNTACNDHNECTSNDRCLNGSCQGTADFTANGKSCTSPFGACVTNPTCMFGFCFGDIV